MENIVVYIPKEACVKNMPLQSLSSSTARKISVALFPHGSEKQMPKTVTWICPVELREEEVAVAKDRREPVPLIQRPLVSKITPGQFSLPVVSSSITAFKVLRTILKTHKPKIKFSGLENDAASLPSIRQSVRQNAIIVYNGQIFLSVRKARCRRVRFQNSPSAPLGVCPVSPSKQNQINTPSCQAQPLPDSSPRPQQSKRQDVQTPVKDLDINIQISPLLHKVSEEMPERCCKDKESQKEDESRSLSSPPKPPEDQETSSSQPTLLQQPQIIHMASVISEQPEAAAAGGEREMHEDDNERLEGALLPRAESCFAFDFEQLAQEERINHLRARLRQKEAALSNFNAKPADQI
ncbi:hypothetical protein cypCar_00019659 [Cyprinus carpio]|uniref:Uncharacterized protein LOC109068762 n=1 Tax=Cyprinus carpio TaxID=7962 RepID=A0A9Q9V6D3_CYPCA|nr:uncharacterized protein LOC109068762 [Cyprinus carpio]KTF77754.1 hypothetical protein cypCar_00019659 [Cyprinus carpio]